MSKPSFLDILNRLHELSHKSFDLDLIADHAIKHVGLFFEADYAYLLRRNWKCLEFWQGYCKIEDEELFWDAERRSRFSVPIATFDEQKKNYSKDKWSISGNVVCTGKPEVIPYLPDYPYKDHFLVTADKILGEILIPILAGPAGINAEKQKNIGVLCLDYLSRISDYDSTISEAENISSLLSTIFQNADFFKLRNSEISFYQATSELIQNINNKRRWLNLLNIVFEKIRDLVGAELVLFWEVDPSEHYLFLQASSSRDESIPKLRFFSSYIFRTMTDNLAHQYRPVAIIGDIPLLEENNSDYSQLVFCISSKDGGNIYRKGFVEFYFNPPRPDRYSMLERIRTYVGELSTVWYFWHLERKGRSLTNIISMLDKTKINTLSEETVEKICAELIGMLPVEASSIWIKSDDNSELILKASTGGSWSIKNKKVTVIEDNLIADIAQWGAQGRPCFHHYPPGTDVDLPLPIPIDDRFGVESLLVVPIINPNLDDDEEKAFIGMIICQNRRRSNFNYYPRYLRKDDADVIQTITSLVILLLQIQVISKREREAGSIAEHEINLPLEIISSSVNVITELSEPKIIEGYKRDIPKTIELRARNIQETIHLISFVARQSIFADPNWKPDPDEEERTFLTPIVAGVVNMLRPIANQPDRGNLEIEYFDIDLIGKKIVPVEPFRQVLFNLIMNAIKYSRAGSTINIFSSDAIKSFADAIIIENVGKGINVSEAENIFKVGYRTEFARSKGPGRGKGLPIARKIMRAINGDVILLKTEQPTQFGIVFKL